MENTKIKDQCRYAVTSAGSSKILPASKDFQDLKSSGSQIKHFHVAPASWLADKCAKVGVDGVVLTGTEGGGHQSYEKVSTLVLLQQVQENHPDLPKIACGGFATGRSLAAALSLGAGAIAMGSRFIATKESEFHETYKNVVPTGKAQETDLYTGGYGPIRLWANEYTKTRGLVKSKEEKMAQEEAMLKLSREEILKEQTKGAKAYIAAYQGDINSGAVLLGQSIGIIKSIESVPDLMEKIMKDAESSIRSISNSIS